MAAGPRDEGPIKLLERIVPGRDAIHSRAEPKDGGLAWDAASSRGLLRIPLRTPREFDLVLELVRTAGEGSFGVGLQSGGGRFLVICDLSQSVQIRHPTANPMAPVRVIGRRVSGVRHGAANSPQLSAVVEGPALPPGELVRLAIAVRHDRIEVRRNGKPWIRWSGDPATLAMHKADESVYADCLFLHNHRSAFAIRRLDLVPLTGWPRGIRWSLSTASEDRLAAELGIWNRSDCQTPRLAIRASRNLKTEFPNLELLD